MVRAGATCSTATANGCAVIRRFRERVSRLPDRPAAGFAAHCASEVSADLLCDVVPRAVRSRVQPFVTARVNRLEGLALFMILLTFGGQMAWNSSLVQSRNDLSDYALGNDRLSLAVLLVIGNLATTLTLVVHLLRVLVATKKGKLQRLCPCARARDQRVELTDVDSE